MDSPPAEWVLALKVETIAQVAILAIRVGPRPAAPAAAALAGASRLGYMIREV